jgi:hypothetical protein
MFKNNSADTFIKEMWVLLIEEMGEIADSHLITKIMKFILELTLYYTHVCMPPLLGISWSIMFYPCPHEVSAQYLMPPSLGSRSITFYPCPHGVSAQYLIPPSLSIRSITFYPCPHGISTQYLMPPSLGIRSITFYPCLHGVSAQYLMLPFSN